MDFENQKIYGTCKESKALEFFTKSSKSPDGRAAQCKACRKAYYAEWYSKNKDKILTRTKQYYKENKDKCVADRKAYAKKHPDKVRAYSRKSNRKKAGLPKPTRPCPSHCEMCLRPAGKRALHLDHDHATGAFRGWLCGCCNTAFGRLGDSFEVALERLNRYQKTTLTPSSGDK